MCKHLNGTLHVEILTDEMYCFEDGHPKFRESGYDPRETGKFVWLCSDCKKELFYSESTAPQWLKARIAAYLDWAQNSADYPD